MAPPLLSTKLFRPTVRQRLVQRQRLFARLDGLLQSRLALVSAPAGYGKTTLVSAWLEDLVSRLGSESVRVAWVSLDPDDNAAAQFLAYLIAALRQIYGNVGGAVLSALEVAPLPPVRHLLVALINELAGCAGDCILVLEDLHLVTDLGLQDAVGFMVDHLPPGLHMVITTRRDPPLELDMLRIHGHLIEVRQSDLSFTEAEASALFAAENLGLSAAQVADLHSHTEGWAAGLQLAALSLQGRDAAERADLIAGFGGAQRHIADLMMSQVYAQQDQAVQRFLLRTSVLERLCEPLCAALVDRGEGSSDILASLEAANLFVVPLDDQRRWYRYHHLLRDYLRERLLAESPELVAPLHALASAWFETHQLMNEAIEHALSAGDVSRATDLVDRAAPETLRRGEGDRFRRWMARLPQSRLLERPELAVVQGSAWIHTGQPDKGLACLDEVERQYPDRLDLRARIAVYRAAAAMYANDHLQGIALAEQALDWVPADSTDAFDIETRASAHRWLGQCKRDLCDWEGAQPHYTQAVALARQVDSLIDAVDSLACLGVIATMQGRARRAIAYHQEALALAEDWSDRLGEGRDPIWATTRPRHQLGRLYYEQNRVVEGIAEIERAMAGMSLAGWEGAQYAYADLGLAHLALGDVTTARSLLVQIESTPGSTQNRLDRYASYSMALQRRLLETSPFDQRLRHEIEKWVDRRFDPDRWVMIREETTHARGLVHGLLALGRWADALQVAEALEIDSRANATWNLVSCALLVQGVALHRLGRPGRALSALDRALDLTEPEAIVRPVTDFGEPMRELLLEAVRSGIHTNYATRLLRVADPGTADPSVTRAQGSDLVEPLTPREMEVLRLLAAGLNSTQVAETLIMGVTTSRSHIRAIYRKLDVHGREEALLKVERLGLV